MKRHLKVIVIGAGFVGSTIAFSFALKKIANEIIIIDIDKNKAVGEVMDIQHGISSMGDQIIRFGDYSDCKDSDLIVITCGRNRRIGETRLNMVKDNIAIMDSVICDLKNHYTKGAIIVVSNPVDILTYWVDKKMGLPSGRVFGTGCMLDVSRLTREIADYLGVKTKMIQCDIVGEHGDSQVVVWSSLFIDGLPIEDYCRKNKIVWNDEIKDSFKIKIKTMGANIIERKGKTHYGIAICVCYLASAILKDKSIVASVTSPLDGEYGIKNVSLSLPSIIDKNGIRERIVKGLNDDENKALLESALQIKKVLGDIE